MFRIKEKGMVFKMYLVKVNGKETKLEEVRVSAMPFNRIWPGKQRDISQSETAYVLHIESEDGVNISVTSTDTLSSVKVRPQSKGVSTNICGNKVELCLQEYGQYVLEINGEHHAVHIFYDKPEAYDTKGAAYSFASGEHRIGKLELNDNDSVYIGKDAILYANIFAVGKKNIRIFGHGTINGSLENRTEKHGDIGWDGEKSFSKEKLHTIGCIRLLQCENVEIDGITITDSSSYATSVYASKNVCINNVKVVGHWKYNNDGIDLINCSDAVIKNSFIRSFDDSICIKGFTAFSDKNCERITVDNCVIWCGWGKTLEIGLATAAKNINGITFSNCDLIHNQGICISIANGQFADISDVLYKNINIEYEYVRREIYQASDDMVYEDGELMLPRLLWITDRRRTWQGNISPDDEPRSIRNVTFENVNVICEKDITPQILIHQANEYGEFDNIKIKTMHVHNNTLTNIDLLSDYEGEDLSLEITRNR